MPPMVSVIVPVRDRRELLAGLLDALSAQTYRDAEIIVVDDGSTDGSGDEAGKPRAGLGAVVVLQAGGAGAVEARRVGAEAAGGDVLAFTDSDCRPAADWLAAGMAAVQAGADLVAGRTRPTRPPGPLERSMSSGREGLYPTCNLFVRAEVFRRAGGFERRAGERLGFRPGRRARGLGFGEDTLLAWKIIREGGVAVHEPGAIVEHHVFPADLADLPGRALQVGAFPALIREVPELRPTLVAGRFFLGSTRRLPFYAVAACLVAGRWRWAAPAAAWWVAARAAGLRPASRPPAAQLALLLGEMATDAVEGAALLAGSIRSRTPVL